LHSEVLDGLPHLCRQCLCAAYFKRSDAMRSRGRIAHEHVPVRAPRIRYVKVERAATEDAFTLALKTICTTVLPRPAGGSVAFGAWRLTDIVTDTIERYREVRRGQGTGVVGVNRHLGSLRSVFNWAVRVGYVEQSPFTRGTEPVIKLSKEHGRSRRLSGDERTKLLAACAPHLRAVVEAALETGMRRGEILSLQWSQVEGMKVERSKVTWASKAEIVLPWGKTKTRRDRRIPISSRLKIVLDMRRIDPAGQPHALDTYVFGTEIGSRILSVGRAWHTAVLKSHGSAPAYTETANLTPESRAALNAIDLHFHDLRREAGSQWLEGGVPLHKVRDWLGHTNIAQTGTYLASTSTGDHEDMRRFEAHQAASQRIAKKAKTGGRKRLQSAGSRLTKPNKTAVGRSSAIM
jgi:integrase